MNLFAKGASGSGVRLASNVTISERLHAHKIEVGNQSCPRWVAPLETNAILARSPGVLPSGYPRTFISVHDC